MKNLASSVYVIATQFTTFDYSHGQACHTRELSAEQKLLVPVSSTVSSQSAGGCIMRPGARENVAWSINLPHMVTWLSAELSMMHE